MMAVIFTDFQYSEDSERKGLGVAMGTIRVKLDLPTWLCFPQTLSPSRL